MYTDKSFERAYLQSLHLIKEDVETEVDTTVETDKAEEKQNPVKKVCFLTSDPDLIDALNSGFEEAVFFVKAKDENGKDTVEEVKFKSDSFDSFEVTDAEEECPECGKTPCECDDETCPECGKSPCECEKDEDLDLNEDDEEEPVEECGNNQITEEGEEFDEEEPVEEGGDSLTEEDIIRECSKLRCKF